MADENDNLHLQDLIDLDVEELSLVDDNAIERPFDVIKRRSPEMKTRKKADPTVAPEIEQEEADGAGEGADEENDPNRAFKEQVERETTVSKSLDLHGLDLDTYRGNICDAVRKSGLFGATRDPWDIFVNAVTEKSVVVRNYNDADKSLTMADFETENGVDFTFANVGKAIMRWDRMPDASNVAKSLGGELDDRDAALNELVDPEALGILKAAIGTKPEGLSADAPAADVIAAKAKVFTRTRIDKLTELRDELNGLLEQVVPQEPGEEQPVVEVDPTKATDPTGAGSPAPAIDAGALAKAIEAAVTKAVKPLRADVERVGDRVGKVEQMVGTVKTEVDTTKAKVAEVAKINMAPKGGSEDGEKEAPVSKRRATSGWGNVLR